MIASTAWYLEHVTKSKIKCVKDYLTLLTVDGKKYTREITISPKRQAGPLLRFSTRKPPLSQSLCVVSAASEARQAQSSHMQHSHSSKSQVTAGPLQFAFKYQ